MMKLFAVRDAKADAFGGLMCLETPGLAIRAFSDACVQPGSPMLKYPQDFSLFEIGDYDPNSGEVKACMPAPRYLASASSVLDSMKREEARVDDKKHDAPSNQVEIVGDWGGK